MHRDVTRLVTLVLAFAFVLLGLTRSARAETREAPLGGHAIPVGEGRVACGPVAGGWAIEAAGKSLRPPTDAAAIGVVTEVKIAPNVAECAKATDVLRVIATGPWPTLDPASFVLVLDEGRLEARGRGLRGVAIAWPVADGFAADACREPRAETGMEACSWGVPKTLRADTGTSQLWWLPPGAVWASDTLLFAADGKRAPPQTFAITPVRVEIAQLLPADASVDVSAGIGLLPLAHPEAVANVECSAVTCAIENGAVSVQAPPASVAAIDVKLRLASHVVFSHKTPADGQVTVRVSILRCPMYVASGPPLRGIASARVVLRVEGGCTRNLGGVRFLVGTRRTDVARVQTEKDAAYVVLAIGSVDAPSLAITAVRGDADATVVAVARTDTRATPRVRTTLELLRFPRIEFIPNNRPAIVHFPRIEGAELALLSIEGVYEAAVEGGVTTVRGDPEAAGQATLQFGYRVPTLPAPLDKVDLAVLDDSLQRPIKEANVPAPFDATAASPTPLVEVLCTDKDAHVQRITPGVPLHVPFAIRDNCRVVIHRERLAVAYGTQKLVLDIDVNKLDGTPRQEAHVSQTIVLRAGDEPRISWLKGISAAYDRAIIKLSLAADEAHYLGASEIVGAAPAAQWTIVFGTGHVRLYATSAIPTGLYRFGDKSTSGVLSLSFGVISRLTWLDAEGHEGLLGLETGLVAFGVTGDTNAAGQSLTQVGAITGVGLTIPLVNAGAATQASINLHGWFEQRVAGGAVGEARSFIFGPSISLGNIGATFLCAMAPRAAAARCSRAAMSPNVTSNPRPRLQPSCLETTIRTVFHNARFALPDAPLFVASSREHHVQGALLERLPVGFGTATSSLSSAQRACARLGDSPADLAVPKPTGDRSKAFL